MTKFRLFHSDNRSVYFEKDTKLVDWDLKSILLKIEIRVSSVDGTIHPTTNTLELTLLELVGLGMRLEGVESQSCVGI
jgi:hypothetical protein